MLKIKKKKNEKYFPLNDDTDDDDGPRAKKNKNDKIHFGLYV